MKAASVTSQAINEINDKLSSAIMRAIDFVADERQRHYEENSEANPTRDTVDDLIAAYANKNALVSGATGLVPGPWGMLAALPEITIVIRHQLMMVYDIGVACGKRESMSKEVLLAVFGSALGLGGAALLTMHGSQVLIKRTSLRAMQSVVAALAGKITQQALKSAVAKWLPVVGAAGMAAWSNIWTRRIGKRAYEILQMQMEISDSTEDAVDVEFDDPAAHEDQITEARIAILINLMKKDGILLAERAHINQIIDSANLPEESKQGLRKHVESKLPRIVDLKQFQQSAEEALILLTEMVALAQVDENIAKTERDFIAKVAKIVGFTAEQVEQMITPGK